MKSEKGILILNEEQDKKLFSIINRGNKTFTVNSYKNNFPLHFR